MKGMFKVATATAVLGAVLVAGCSSDSDEEQSASFSPAVIYDTAGKFDKSFNEAVFRNGVEEFNTDHDGVTVSEFEPQNEEQREQGLRRLASNGNSPIVAVGFNFSSSIEKVATEFPDTQFAIIDSVVDLPNVQSIVFAEHQGSFLVGALAAMASENGAVGFVGGMDIPLISKFACGFEQGAKYVNPNIEYFENMTGSTPAAFADPARGSELAKSQISQGADVIFAAAGGTGIGVYQAAADEGVYAIGVDSNQNYLQPGTMLTSMVKRVGVAAYQTWEEAQAGNWEGGIKVLDLSAGGVDWALDEFNQDLIQPAWEERMAQIRQAIIDGDIDVYDYTTTGSCDF
ncbi:BMP family lipoprotein [Saccharospirillum mangrovi]|uniref:BMP family lipoprotein n=1 Tax=Saccharospirillum mangrovi TaxID=2161747 RepID=UPI000D33CF68|nr:BMP family ABC transporter substrate-binding protein [Saccharospirillum mangrovi]